MHLPTDSYTAHDFQPNGNLLVDDEKPRMPPPTKPRPPERRPEPARPRLGRILLVVLVLAGVGIFFGLTPRLQKRAVVAQETHELSIPSVLLVSAAPAQAGEPITLNGELKAQLEAPLYARSNGYVKSWSKDLGAHVKTGDVLAEIETPEIDRELATARAELKQAESTRDLAQATSKRWVQMLSARTVSPQEAQEKESDYSSKQAAVEAAKENVARLQQMVGFNKIVAPFDGTLTARNLDVGQLVNAGSGRELFRLSQTEKLRVFVRVPQSYARAVKENQSAELVLTELPGRTFTAKIVRTAGAIDVASRTLLTELEVDNAKGELLSGSYAQVRLAESLPEASLTIPSNCLLFRAEGPQVGIVDANNVVELRTIKIGRDFGPRIEILEGVNPTDRIVLNPPDAIVSGVQVRVESHATPEPK